MTTSTPVPKFSEPVLSAPVEIRMTVNDGKGNICYVIDGKLVPVKPIELLPKEDK